MKLPDRSSFSNVSVIEAGPLDNNILYDMDLKCFDYPWEPEEWQDWLKSHLVLIAETSPNLPSAKAVGFAACMLLEDGLFIEKIGVKPNCRKQGISRKLISAVQLRADKRKWPHVVTISIPEMFLAPGNPIDVSGWVKKVGFKAKTPLQPNLFDFNGQLIDDVPCILE